MDLVTRLADAVTELSERRDRVLVAVDGPDTAGKTTLADRLAAALPLPAIRASVDGFHQPREFRHRRGGLSPEGYYHDSFDYPALLAECLHPFRDGADSIRPARYDHRADATREAGRVAVPVRAVLVFDGVFLLRRQVRDVWSLSVHLRVSPEETLRRARSRDLDLFGTYAEIERRYRARYLPGQALYRRDAEPERAAHVVVDNERSDAPVVERWSVPATGRWGQP